MTAKEMFEKLGYEYVNEVPICYTKNDGGFVELIEFIDTRQEIIFREYEEYNEDKPQGMFSIDKFELQAINKQVEELGWNK